MDSRRYQGGFKRAELLQLSKDLQSLVALVPEKLQGTRPQKALELHKEISGVLGQLQQRLDVLDPDSEYHGTITAKGLKRLTERLREVYDSIPTAPPTEAPRGLLSYLREVEQLGEKIVARLSFIEGAKDPPAFFDPSDPRLFGALGALALSSTERLPLTVLKDAPFFGSGIYALYYKGNKGSFELYTPLAGTEHPIYVGSAAPAHVLARTAREQDTRLYRRLMDHVGNIQKAANLDLADFECRFLVVASGWQLPAETAMIGLFKPIWNKETNIVVGFGKHGDSPTTRSNKRSAWDTIHPGRGSEETNILQNNLEESEIRSRIKQHLMEKPLINSTDQIRDVLIQSIQLPSRVIGTSVQTEHQKELEEVLGSGMEVEDDVSDQE